MNQKKVFLNSTSLPSLFSSRDRGYSTRNVDIITSIPIINAVHPVKETIIQDFNSKHNEVQKAVTLLWDEYKKNVFAPKVIISGKNIEDVGILRANSRLENIEGNKIGRRKFSREKALLRETIDGLNESLLDEKIQATELKKENKILRRENTALKNELESHVAEINYLNKMNSPGDPWVVRKIARLEKNNRELVFRWEKLLSKNKKIRHCNKKIKSHNSMAAVQTEENLVSTDVKNTVNESSTNKCKLVSKYEVLIDIEPNPGYHFNPIDNFHSLKNKHSNSSAKLIPTPVSAPSAMSVRSIFPNLNSKFIIDNGAAVRERFIYDEQIRINFQRQNFYRKVILLRDSSYLINIQNYYINDNDNCSCAGFDQHNGEGCTIIRLIRCGATIASEENLLPKKIHFHQTNDRKQNLHASLNVEVSDRKLKNDSSSSYSWGCSLCSLCCIERRIPPCQQFTHQTLIKLVKDEDVVRCLKNIDDDNNNNNNNNNDNNNDNKILSHLRDNINPSGGYFSYRFINDDKNSNDNSNNNVNNDNREVTFNPKVSCCLVDDDFCKKISCDKRTEFILRANNYIFREKLQSCKCCKFLSILCLLRFRER